MLLCVCRGRWAITCNDAEFGGQGNKDTGDDFWGAPDLDHTNPHLREALVHWLQHLRDNIGYRGWRFDFAKVCCMALLECVLGMCYWHAQCDGALDLCSHVAGMCRCLGLWAVE